MRLGGIALVGVLLCAGSPAWAQFANPDVGLLTRVAGEVMYWNSTDQPHSGPPKAFMKVRQGDHFKLSPEGEAQLLYFASGRQETWKGPATFAAGKECSLSEGGQAPPGQPEVRMIPPKAARQLAGAPLPLPRSRLLFTSALNALCLVAANTAAGPQAEKPLSPKAREEIKAAEEQYMSLREQMPERDLTPELYLLGVLAQYSHQRKGMEEVLDRMLKKRPGDPTLEKMLNWVRLEGRMCPPRARKP